MKITISPNMVCMVNHATEDLQYRILDFALPCEMERAREDSYGRRNCTE